MSEDLDPMALPDLLEPYGWADVLPYMHGDLMVEVRLKPSSWDISEIGMLRADYFEQAQRAADALAKAGWRQAGKYQFELSDQAMSYKPDGTPDDWRAEAVLRLELDWEHARR